MLNKGAMKKAKGKYKLEGHLKSERVECSGSQNEERGPGDFNTNIGSK